MTISLIAAVAANRVIGKDNDLPWKLPDDMKHFQKTTIGSPVIMGRKNWESIPERFRPLKDRKNIVISRNVNYSVPEGVLVSDDLKSVLWTLTRHADKTDQELFIIGGAEIYKMALPYAEKLYLTEIDAEIEGNVYFPEWDKSQWTEISRIHHPADEKHRYPFDFVVYEKERG